MSGNLAIICPQIGTLSETFIRRHILSLYPNKTVIIVEKTTEKNMRTWEAQAPFYLLDNDSTVQKSIRILGRFFENDFLLKMGLKGVKEFLEIHNIKIVLGEFLDVSWSFRKLLKDMGIRFYAHAHGCDLSILYKYAKWRRRYAQFVDADGLIVVNRIMRERLLGLGIPAEKVHYIPYGVDVPDSLFRVDSPGKNVCCLAVGRMVAKKAPLTLLESFRIASLCCESLRLDYVGDGPLYNSAEEFIQTHNLESKVTLHGGCDHPRVLELMQVADIFLQHSVTDQSTGDEEGLPLTILEAMANGLAIVSTRHAGIPDAVLDQFTGLLADERDCQTMASHIVTLAKDHKMRFRMGCGGWKRARKYFTWEREKADLLSVMGLKPEKSNE